MAGLLNLHPIPKETLGSRGWSSTAIYGGEKDLTSGVLTHDNKKKAGNYCPPFKNALIKKFLQEKRCKHERHS